MSKTVIVLIIAGALGLSILLVASILALARKFSWFDHLNERKIHQGMIPRLGGVGFSLSFIIVSLFVMFFLPALNIDIDFHRDAFIVFAASSLIIVFGVVDDFRSIRPRYKMFIQFIAATIVLYADITFHFIKIPFLAINIDMGLFRYVVTMVWIIGITNAVNLIDGIDGLAGGTSLISSLTLAIVFVIWKNDSASLLSLIMAASIAGFLVFNLPFPKAKIFMGDCGSQFLGFMLAVLPLLNNGAGGASLPLPFAAALMLIPIFDTFAAIWRRVRDGRKIGSPDRQHLHHKLLNLGFSVLKIDALIWTLQIVISVFVLLSFRSDDLLSFIFLLVPYVLVSIFFSVIHIYNRRLRSSSVSLNGNGGVL